MTTLDQGAQTRDDPVLLIDVGGSKLAMALAVSGVITERIRIEGMDRMPTAEHLVQAITETAELVGWTGSYGDHGTVAVAVPGMVDLAGEKVISAANLPLAGYPLASELRHRLKTRRVILEDDANCGVVGEHRRGAARSHEYAAYLSLSTGVGMGLIANGSLIEGASRCAGEVGHVPIRPGGRACGCGRFGCLEAYFSGRALARAGEEAVRSGYAAGLRDKAGSLTGRDVVEAAYSGDPDLYALLRDAIADLVVGVQVICAVIDPSIVVIGGGLTKNAALASDVLDALRREIALNTVKFEPAALGDDSVLMGALELVAPEERLVGR